MPWPREIMRAIRDNAAYEVFRLVILAIFLPLGYGVWRLMKQQPLQWGVLLGFIGVGLLFLVFALIKLKKKGAKFSDSDDVKVELVSDRWASPALAIVVNRDRDHPAHIKRATLYGILPNGREQRITDSWKHKFPDCVVLPYSLPPDREARLAFAGHLPYESFNKLFVELEFENSSTARSPQIPSPRPPVSVEKSENRPTQSLPYPHVPPELIKYGVAVVPPRDLQNGGLHAAKNTEMAISAACQEFLDKVTALLKDRSKYRMPMNALCEAGAHKLDSNDQVLWICDQLEQHGYENPFDVLDEYVWKTERLEFIRWAVRHANINMTSMKGINYFDAAEQWRKDKGHPEPSEKGRLALGVRKALSKQI